MPTFWWNHLSLLIAIAGLVIYLAVDSKPKISEAGRILFWVCLLAWFFGH